MVAQAVSVSTVSIFKVGPVAVVTADDAAEEDLEAATDATTSETGIKPVVVDVAEMD